MPRPAPALIAAALLALPGCQRLADRLAPPAGFVAPERPNDSCNSAQYREYVGGPVAATDDLVFVDPVRFLPPGSAMTTDYSPTRLNFDIDSEGNVTRVWCG